MTTAIFNAQRTPRDLEVFAKKVADGKKGTTDFLTAEEFFKRLPGWQVEHAVGALEVDEDRLAYWLRGDVVPGRAPRGAAHPTEMPPAPPEDEA